MVKKKKKKKKKYNLRIQRKKNCFATFDAFHIQYTNCTDVGDDLNFNGKKNTDCIFMRFDGI